MEIKNQLRRQFQYQLGDQLLGQLGYQLWVRFQCWSTLGFPVRYWCFKLQRELESADIYFSYIQYLHRKIRKLECSR